MSTEQSEAGGVAREALARGAGLLHEAVLECVPECDPRATGLAEAMQYSLHGGKRLRGVLVMRSASTFGLDPEAVLPAACAFEMLHAATLIHDDLPCIDDSDLRRGRESCHIAFGEHTALLAADALLIASFEQLASLRRTCDPDRTLRVVEEFAQFTGANGLIGGEQADIISEQLAPDVELLRFIHKNKTAKLICAACRTGAILAGADEQHVAAISDYGMTLGLLFQVTDDILDVVGDEDVLGKPTGADEGKQTYPQAIGLDGAQEEARRLADHAMEIAAELPAEIAFWRSMAELVVTREK